MSENKTINISGEPLVDTQICKFVVDHPIYPNNSFNCRSKLQAKGSPLLEALFAIDGIRQVLVESSTITIAKTNDTPWPDMGKQIGDAIRNTINSGVELIAENAANKLPSEESIRNQIEELFEQQINPAIASHGGSVELTEVVGSKVFVRLGGGCQGCSSANATLKLGIEKAIKELVPEVTDVLDATDHAAGIDPYYK